MYTYSKLGQSARVEKSLTRHGDNFAAVHIELATYEGKMVRVYVSAFAAPFGKKSRFRSQFFDGDGAVREGWKLFKKFQDLLGGDFDDE